MAHWTIVTGTYFGECIGICRDTLTITAETMDYVASSNTADPSSPEIVDGQATETDQWKRLISLVDMAALHSLPDKIGDPDARDEGGEYVEISDGTVTKRVDFSFGTSVPEIDDLLAVLRELRGEFAAQHR